MKCKNCGSEIINGSKFCVKCGAAVKNQPRLNYGKCPKCGAVILSGNTFCTNCGESLETDEDYDDYYGNNKCPGCGANIPEGSSFCVKCGEPVEGCADDSGYDKSYENNRKSVKKEKSKTGNTLIIILSLISALFVICVISAAVVYFMFFGGNKSTENKETETEISEEETAEEADGDNSEIQEQVDSIRKQYNDIVASITTNAYDEIEISDGVSAYYDGNDLKAVSVSKGVHGSDYERAYYYSGNSLIYAYYEGTDVQKFYYSNSSLIRQRYYPDSSDLGTYTDYDKGSSENTTWEKAVLSEAENYYYDWKEALEAPEEETEEEPVEEEPYQNYSGYSGSQTADYNAQYFENLLMSYCVNMCSAINQGSYSVVSGYIQPGSSLETAQISLVSRLYNNGTKEAFKGLDFHTYTIDGNFCYMYVAETETITYASGKTETNTYEWKYTAVYSDGSWLLSNIE